MDVGPDSIKNQMGAESEGLKKIIRKTSKNQIPTRPYVFGCCFGCKDSLLKGKSITQKHMDMDVWVFIFLMKSSRNFKCPARPYHPARPYDFWRPARQYDFWCPAHPCDYSPPGRPNDFVSAVYIFPGLPGCEHLDMRIHGIICHSVTSFSPRTPILLNAKQAILEKTPMQHYDSLIAPSEPQGATSEGLMGPIQEQPHTITRKSRRSEAI